MGGIRNLSGFRRLFADKEPFPILGNQMKRGTLKSERF
jgi:hypothetical protein